MVWSRIKIEGDPRMNYEGRHLNSMNTENYYQIKLLPIGNMTNLSFKFMVIFI